MSEGLDGDIVDVWTKIEKATELELTEVTDRLDELVDETDKRDLRRPARRR